MEENAAAAATHSLCLRIEIRYTMKLARNGERMPLMLLAVTQ